MEHDPHRDAVHAAITTAEQRNLGNVLEVIRRLEELRGRGLSSPQIAERMRLTHPYRPGGGPWSAEAVERVLQIADATRRPGNPQPSAQVTQPVPTAVPDRASAPAAQAYPPPIQRPTAAPAQHSDQGVDHRRGPGDDQTVGGEPPLQRPEYRSPAAYVAVGSERPDGRQAPLRVEPRRYHQRPMVQPETGFEPDGNRRRPIVAGLLALIGLIGLVAVGVGLHRVGAFDRFTTTGDGAAPAAPETTGSTTSDDQAVGTTSGADGATASGDVTEDAADAMDGNEADSLVIRIEPTPPETDGGVEPASATIRTDGKLYIEGAFRSESEAQRFLEAAAQVFGEAARVPGFTIDPAAPDPTVSDIVLEKPVLFESGSAVIDPEYIPFLEACGDVLKLNPRIVMSVSAFTDSSGSAEFNLELSQQRADAVIDFYRNLDIGDDQLISTGMGESDFVADNDTEEGRRRNRRAILELLNVMQDG